MSHSQQLQRRLSTRHIRFIALGSAIGTGLFYGSSEAIKSAGPAVLLSYLIAGIAVFIVMRALGEMAVNKPVTGSFSQYATEYIGPLAGFVTGWTYCFEMVIVAIADVTAFGIYMGFWFPDVSRWVWVLSIIFIIGGINLMSVRVFGELEFWFSLLKVTAIGAMIIAGLGLILFGIGSSDGQPTGIHHLWSDGGFFPNGMEGILLSLAMTMFAFGGIEVIGISAGEAENPKRVIPRAINSVPLRILVFYIGTVFVLTSIYPWDQIGNQGSPFVQLFEHLGIKSAAMILNIVVITASISAINSDVFGAGRMMYGMAQKGQAPKVFATLSRFGIPWMTVTVIGVALLAAVVLNALMPESAFLLVASLGTFATLWVWLMILLAQMGMRRKMSREAVDKLEFPLRGYPVAPILAIAFMVLVIGLIGYMPDTRISLYAGGVWLLLLLAAYAVWGRQGQK